MWGGGQRGFVPAENWNLFRSPKTSQGEEKRPTGNVRHMAGQSSKGGLEKLERKISIRFFRKKKEKKNRKKNQEGWAKTFLRMRIPKERRKGKRSHPDS